MALDDKLKEIKVYPTHNGFLPDHALAQIKQAFVEEGYIDFKKEYQVKGFMTGQEWYDRFEKELGAMVDYYRENLWNSVEPSPAQKILYEQQNYKILQAARKAAGL